MPNHCSNHLVVKGRSGPLAQFKALARNDSEVPPEDFDISKFISMPEELRAIRSPNNDPQSAANMVSKYGYPDWYEWANAVWGTKWGTYQSNLYHDEQDQLGYAYQTAWSPLNEDCIGKLSALFPDLTFEVKYAEIGVGYYGFVNAEKGVLTENETLELRPPAQGGRRLRRG